MIIINNQYCHSSLMPYLSMQSTLQSESIYLAIHCQIRCHASETWKGDPCFCAVLICPKFFCVPKQNQKSSKTIKLSLNGD